MDCNSFFASCEQVFRPDLRGRPVVVTSGGGGVVVAASAEAKALGLETPCPYFKVEGLLRRHGAAVFSANFPLYSDVSNRVMRTLAQLSPHLEVYSIDECFLRLRGGDLELLEEGRRIRQRLWRDTRVPVSVGMAPSRTLAKLANRVAKRTPRLQGVCALDQPHKWEWVLERTAPGDLWGVARGTSARLAGLGIRTGLQLARADPERVRRHTSVRMQAMIQELNGVPSRSLHDPDEPQKQIYCTRTFTRKLTQLEPLQRALAGYAARVCEKLRAQGSLATGLHVFMHTSPRAKNFHKAGRVVALPHPTSDTRVVTAAVRGLAEGLYSSGHRFRRAGVGLTGLVPEGTVQEALFGAAQTERDERLMQAMDAINRRQGRDTLYLASRGAGPGGERHPNTSPQYTTDWADIPLVRC